MEMQQNSFMFYSNFLDAIDQLPESERANACYQLCKYALNDELPEDKSLAMFCIGVRYSVHKYQGRGGNHNPTGKNQYTKSGQSGQTGQNGQKETPLVLPISQNPHRRNASWLSNVRATRKNPESE